MSSFSYCNVFITTAISSFKTKNTLVRYPSVKSTDVMRYSSSMSAEDYYEKVLGKDDRFLLTENCRCYLEGKLNENGHLTSANISSVFYKTESSKKKKWVYLRIDIECEKTADLASHFIPHIHFSIQENDKFINVENVKIPGPILTKKVIYNCLSMIHRMANYSDWLKQRRNFAESNGLYDVVKVMDEVDKQHALLGEKIMTDVAFRQSVIEMNEKIEDALNQNAFLEIPIADDLLEMRKVYSYYGNDFEELFSKKTNGICDSVVTTKPLRTLRVKSGKSCKKGRKKS